MEGYQNNYWVFGVVVKPESRKNAKQIMEKLKNKGIGTRPFFWPMHKQPVLAEYFQEILPVSELLSENGFYLPSGVGTTDEEIEEVSYMLNEILH